MANKVGIPIEAQLDTSSAEQSINSFGQRVAQANRVKFNPVSNTAVADVVRLRKETEEYLKVASTLRQRVKDTGQGGKALHELDFERMFPNKTARSVQMMRAGLRVFGSNAFEGSPEKPQPGNNSWQGQAANVAQAGLRAAGPAGGVAANAIGTGMASGAGAGLAGLMGGMLALGIGKVVSGVMEKIEQAESNSIALDKLKRSLGDVNVSFNALKAVVHGSADNLKITYAEAGQLASQFTKLGNVTSEQYKTISDELGVGVGVSRAFGMDPSAGVGVMGQLRGVGVTSNTQESRRFALLIGETIGKSNAFAKSEEVMEALANYATSQTRNNLGRANVEGYAGMYSAMVGSGIPGLDPSGAGALLARINASLSAGGAKGEASQFFTGSIGSSMGLNPYQTRMLREGGAFATADGMFGNGSAYAAYKKLKPGDARPGGSATFLQSSLDKLRSQYGEGSDELADATANHLGIGINQAMGLLSLKPNQMGGLSKKYGDLTKFSSVANLAKIEFGTADDRKAVAKNLLGRTGSDAISSDDRQAIQGADTDEKLKAVLGQVASKYDQERTTGSDIRDSKNILDNIKTSLVDNLVPIKLGIMHMAGVKDGKSPREIMEAVLKAEGKDKIAGVSAEEGNKVINARSRLDAVNKKKEELTLEYRKQYGKFTNNPDEYHRQMKELAAMEEFATRELNKAKTEYAKAIKDATQEVEDSMTDHKLGLAPGTTSGKRMARESDKAGSAPAGGGSAVASAAPVGSAPAAAGSAGAVGAGKASGNVAEFVKEHGPLAEKVAAKLGVPADAVLAQWGLETGWGRSVIKGTNNLGNIKDFSGQGPKAKDNMTGSVDSYRAYGTTEDFGEDFSRLLGKSRYAGALGTKDAKSYFSGLKAGGYAEDPNYVSKGVQAAAMVAKARAAKLGTTPTPEAAPAPVAKAGTTPMPTGAGTGTAAGAGAGAGRGSVNPEYRISADDITVRVVDANGKPMAPAQNITTRVTAAKPFGASVQ